MAKVVDGGIQFRDFKILDEGCSPVTAMAEAELGTNTFEKVFNLNCRNRDSEGVLFSLQTASTGRLELEFLVTGSKDELQKRRYAKVVGDVRLYGSITGYSAIDPATIAITNYIESNPDGLVEGETNDLTIQYYADATTGIGFNFTSGLSADQVIIVRGRILGSVQAAGADLQTKLVADMDGSVAYLIPYIPSGNFAIDEIVSMGSSAEVVFPRYIKSITNDTATCGTSTISIDLRPASEYVAGETIIISDASGLFDVAGWTLTITPYSGDDIDTDSGTIDISANKPSIILMSDGTTHWHVISFWNASLF